jgi:transposase
MARAYSPDLRLRILKAYDDGIPVADVVEQFSVSRATVYSFIKQRRDTGRVAPKEYRHGQERKLAPYEQAVRQLVSDQPDATLEELHAQLPNKDDVTVVTLHNYLKHLKITRKKRLSALPSDTEPMLPKSVKNGKHSKRHSTLKTSFSSTKLGRKRT